MVTVNIMRRKNPLEKAIETIARTDVMVGIPQENSSREKAEGKEAGINNAELLFILSQGVRKKEMRDEMQKNLDTGMRYSKAHELYIQAHGSPAWHSPPRPVLEPSIKANKEAIARKLQAAYKAVLVGDPDYREKYELAGMYAQNKARAWFTDPNNNWPPNAPETIRRKGSSRPNIDTSEMRKSIVYVVRES